MIDVLEELVGERTLVARHCIRSSWDVRVAQGIVQHGRASQFKNIGCRRAIDILQDRVYHQSEIWIFLNTRDEVVGQLSTPVQNVKLVEVRIDCKTERPSYVCVYVEIYATKSIQHQKAPKIGLSRPNLKFCISLGDTAGKLFIDESRIKRYEYVGDSQRLQR